VKELEGKFASVGMVKGIEQQLQQMQEQLQQVMGQTGSAGRQDAADGEAVAGRGGRSRGRGSNMQQMAGQMGRDGREGQGQQITAEELRALIENQRRIEARLNAITAQGDERERMLNEVVRQAVRSNRAREQLEVEGGSENRVG
jgi:hypothetical protein